MDLVISMVKYLIKGQFISTNCRHMKERTSIGKEKKIEFAVKALKFTSK